jgi:hypothetical protein
MNSSLMPSYLDTDIFVNNISCMLYREQLENLYWTCRTMHAELDKSGEYIYNKICLHHNPHSIDDLPIISRYGKQEWYKEGKLHRDGDLPATIYVNGDQYWYKEGKRHRDDDLPAVIHANGDQSWYKEGKIHRDGDLPAVNFKNEYQSWYKEGKKHRDGDLPAVIHSNGTQQWYKEGIDIVTYRI